MKALDPITGQTWQVYTQPELALEYASPDPQSPWVLTAGFFDLQVNGFGGLDFNAPGLTPETVRNLVHLQAAEGVVAFLPTLVTGGFEHTRHNLQSIAQACQQWPEVAQAIPGIHLEGPYISPQDGARGAHPLEHVRPPSLAEFEQWQQAAQGRVTLVTLAPEWPGTAEFVAALVAQGIRVALGHTMASGEEIERAVAAGASFSTHLGNGAPAQLPRHPNMIWDQLGNPHLEASFILDGHHLPPITARALIQARGIERSHLVSDSVGLGGMPPGVYDTAVGGRVKITPQGRPVLYGTPYLAGSVISLRQAVGNAVKLCGFSQAQAIQMAFYNPCRYMGFQPAALTLLHWPAEQQPQVALCRVAGRVLFRNGGLLEG